MSSVLTLGYTKMHNTPPSRFNFGYWAALQLYGSSTIGANHASSVLLFVHLCCHASDVSTCTMGWCTSSCVCGLVLRTTTTYDGMYGSVMVCTGVCRACLIHSYLRVGLFFIAALCACMAVLNSYMHVVTNRSSYEQGYALV